MRIGIKGVIRDIPRWSGQARALLRRGARHAKPLRQSAEAVIHAKGSPSWAKLAAFRTALVLYAAEDLTAALVAGERLLPRLVDSAQAHLIVATWYRHNHAILRPLELVAHARTLRRVSPVPVTRLDQQARWLAQGLPMSEPKARAFVPHPQRVIYFVASSLPHHPVGYGMRTHNLVRALAAMGWDMHIVARDGYPNDRWDYPHWALAAKFANLDGIPYRFSPNRAKLRYARDIEGYHRSAADVFEAQCRDLRPALIHAASNYNCGIVAAEVGRRLGIPVVYEVRGFWQVTKAARDPGYAESDHFRMIAGFETQAAQAAAHVFAITSGVANVLARAGVAQEKLSLLPNAVEVDAFSPLPRDQALAVQYQLADTTVLGYVGSLNSYEGLDDLLTAVAQLRGRSQRVAVLIVGDGPQRTALEQQARELGLTPCVHFVGRVAAAEVPRYLSVIDVVVLARKPLALCELVSPLKPFEVMAMERTILASNVAAQADIVTDGVTGRLFEKGSVADLTQKIDELINDPAQRVRLGKAAGHWVRTQRTWADRAANVAAVYQRLLVHDP